MDRVCELIAETLVEVAGDPVGLSAAEREHLDACPSCRALAQSERHLDEVLAAAVPPADPALQQWVIAALRPLRGRRRLAALLPVAASLLTTLTGVAALGGVPGASMLRHLPTTSAHGWLSLVGAANDWVIALAATSRAAQLGLPGTVTILSLAAAALGTASVMIATRRWRPLAPWQRHA